MPKSPPAVTFTCPRCSMTSYDPTDAREGYCGNCHDWTAHDTRPGAYQLSTRALLAARRRTHSRRA